MKLVAEQLFVVEFAAKNPSTHMLVHGRAGVGKSVVRDSIVECCRGTTSVILGPTGMSVSAKMPTPYVFTCARFLKATPATIKDVNALASSGVLLGKDIIKRAQIIIEEAGMLSPTEFCALNVALQKTIGSRKPFGGIRIIIFCDVLQLKPVEGTYFFETDAFGALHSRMTAFELEMVHRRKYNDDEAHHEFQTFLQELRENSVRQGSVADNLLKYFYPTRNMPPPDALRLFCTNEKVDVYNKKALESCEGRELMLQPTGSVQRFKKNARVQVTQNIYVKKKLLAANGIMGRIISIKDDGQELLESSVDKLVVTKDSNVTATIVTDDGKNVVLEATHTAGLPLSLAYAVTVHRVQGQTLENVVFDGHNMFDSQHLYTAASRVRSLHSFYCKNVDVEALYTLQRDPRIDTFLREHGFS